MRSDFLFTSESVSEGHPDKVSDQIADAIVDLFLAKDPEARVACETLTTTQTVILAGEIRGDGIMDVEGNWAPGVKDEIEATVRVAHSLGMDTVAEGIETAEQAAVVGQLGSDKGQGYLFSRPLDTQALERWLLEE